MNPVVVDASVSASWLFDDEDDPRADATLTLLQDTPGLVPQLWHYEMRNILLVAHRRRRITANGMAERIAALHELPLETDNDPDLDHALTLAADHNLSFYDALYLELAERRQALLASLDKRLLDTARAEGVQVQE